MKPKRSVASCTLDRATRKELDKLAHPSAFMAEVVKKSLKQQKCPTCGQKIRKAR